MPTYTYRNLPPEYLDHCLRDLEINREYSARSHRWRRIPLDLLPIRRRIDRSSDSSNGRGDYYVLPHELAHAICRGLGLAECGCDGDEPFRRWLKSRIAIKRHAGRITP